METFKIGDRVHVKREFVEEYEEFDGVVVGADTEVGNYWIVPDGEEYLDVVAYPNEMELLCRRV